MKRILVVDDNPSILEAIELILTTENYIVKTLARGDGIMMKVLGFNPHAIILDLLLSGLNGKDIIFELRKEKKTKNIPIIMISAHPSAKSVAKMAGADDFLAKPFDINLLLSVIKKNIKKVQYKIQQ